MIQIKALNNISYEAVKKFGFNGFMTDYVYRVSQENRDQGFCFNIEKERLDNTYVKEWRTSEESVAGDNETLKLGLSFGAYEEEDLVGFLIVTKVSWNNSLWIENIRVADSHRGLGIAQKMLSALEDMGKTAGYRLIGLEVMASNYPAIELYKKYGYQIDGLDRSHYPTRPGGQKEVALFMKYYLSDLI